MLFKGNNHKIFYLYSLKYELKSTRKQYSPDVGWDN